MVSSLMARSLYSRLHLLLSPLLRNGRDRVVGLLTLIERARGIAIGEDDAALILRHRDDLERIVVERHQILAAHEVLGVGECLSSGVEDLQARGLLRVGELQRCRDPCLLLVGSGSRRQRRRIRVPAQYLAGDRVHVRACARELRIGARANLRT